MTIFLDLDDTLIHAVPLRGGRLGRRRLVRCSDGDGYGVMERPLAQQMIADCCALARVVILTTGAQDYAESVCRALEFSVDDILGCEKYIRSIPGEGDTPMELGVDPDSWLIDNAEPNFLYSKLKMAYLGTSRSRYLKVRTFTGIDPKTFPEEWRQIVDQISRP